MRVERSQAKLVLAALVLTAATGLAQEGVTLPTTGKSPSGADQEAARLPDGLEVFLHGCLLEASGQYREALAEYEKAIELAGDVTEVKVRYAALLQELGLADTAVGVLSGVKELDWYGLRTRALALAQLVNHRPELLPEAEKALRAALDQRSDDPNLEVSLAQVVQRQGRLEEAETIIAAMSSARRGSPQLATYHAGLLRAMGRLEEAAELYRQCATSPACTQGLVEVLIAMGRPAEAGAALLERLGDDDLDQLLQAAGLLSEGGRYAEALAAVRRVLRVDPKSTRARTLEAFLLSSTGSSEEAVVRLKSLLREDQDNLDLSLSLAWNLARGGKLEEARELLGQAWSRLETEPLSERAVACSVAAARVELASGHPRVAREWLERVSGSPALGADYVRLLGATFRRTGEWPEGVASLLRIQPRLEGQARTEAVAIEAEFRLRRGELTGLERLRPLLESDRVEDAIVAVGVLQATERWADTEREAAAALVRHPGARDLRFARAAALERLGRADQAEQVFAELVKDHPDDAAAANYLGYMWADRGVNLDEALRLITRAVELEPNTAAFLDSFGWVQFRLGNLEAAENWLRRAIAVGDRDGTVLAHLGEVLIARGAKEEASSLLRQAIDFGCEQPERIRALLAGLGD